MAYEGAVAGGVVTEGAVGGCCCTPNFCGIAIVTVIILLLIAMGILF
ncbi:MULTISPECIES: hypothetical protein [Dehalobacter]|jgi:hypothetical protein|uniref:Sporulation protein YjcZ n=1 Tax=Dehalobacter restrictus (strain DSM 9455 / PER-K23) TaxID=871738 RepID=A0ABN4BSR2_DEHRP|nr:MULTISPECIES: hypothetical protein [Dehalobacter]AFV01995.1 hypothetical protein DHBDCA_p968 [Dehalobacter sp. DCA]AFV05031.1 hypothetical protein DCF50_p1026 [Dehalobacter sp. CF]AHF10254.1 hypothetical protein DEHRE_09310 [Dehalobacter restrictus DSM 9455]EQB20841.1 hypothetical protein UNSWDHB_1914 [Dehalobacter sp. UNSWDHB]MCG1024262.1 hypothetical protein [Dehalobacter sp.]